MMRIAPGTHSRWPSRRPRPAVRGNRCPWRRVWFATAWLALLPALGASDPPLSQVPAAPQRPAKSSDARTAPEGHVQLETGVDVDQDDLFTNLTFRFGLTRALDFSLAITPYLRIDLDGQTESGFGDTTLGAKVRFFESPDGDAAIEGFVKIPTADEDQGLGTGDLDAGFRFIASRAWQKNDFDFNLGGEFAGVPEADSNDARWTTILTWSRHSGERFTYFGELFVQFLPAADVENITTDWGVSYAFNPSFVLDGAVYIGLSDDAPDIQLTVGLTKVIGRLFTPERDSKARREIR